jgi:hypothetical protein
MIRYRLAYATANDRRGFFRDLLNFGRLAAFDPGVPQVDLFIAAGELESGGKSDCRDLAWLCRLAETNSRLRVRKLVFFKPDRGEDAGSRARCLSAMAGESPPGDYVLCLDRETFGPLGAGWYAHYVRHMEAGPRRERLHIVNGERDGAPFRPWMGGDFFSPRNLGRCLAWQLVPWRPDRGTDPWADWAANLSRLYYLGLEEEIPNSRLLAGIARDRDAAPRMENVELSAFASRVGVHLHLHYQDLWPEFRADLANLPPGFGLHVTTSQDNPALFRSIAAEFPGATVTVMPNRGRDIGPFLALLGSGAFERYEYVCKLHSKKSPAGGGESYFGRVWRRQNFADLLGSPAQVGRILSLFEADPAVGVVGSAVLRVPNERMPAEEAIGGNRDAVDALLAKCAGRSVSVSLQYFAGSMFWFRPKALQAIRALAISAEDFPEEPCRIDGSLAHALERVVPMAAALSGYRIADAPQPGGAD